MRNNLDFTKGIPFTQFLRPDGERLDVWINRSNEVTAKAKLIVEALFNFEAEVLSNGDVSLTVSDAFGDYAFQIVPNRKAVPEAVDRLILEFDIEKGLAERKRKA